MYEIRVCSKGAVLEALGFSYLEEAESVAAAFENLTDYTVVRLWEEEWK